MNNDPPSDGNLRRRQHPVYSFREVMERNDRVTGNAAPMIAIDVDAGGTTHAATKIYEGLFHAWPSEDYFPTVPFEQGYGLMQEFQSRVLHDAKKKNVPLDPIAAFHLSILDLIERGYLAGLNRKVLWLIGRDLVRLAPGFTQLVSDCPRVAITASGRVTTTFVAIRSCELFDALAAGPLGRLVHDRRIKSMTGNTFIEREVERDVGWGRIKVPQLAELGGLFLPEHKARVMNAEREAGWTESPYGITLFDGKTDRGMVRANWAGLNLTVFPVPDPHIPRSVGHPPADWPGVEGPFEPDYRPDAPPSFRDENLYQRIMRQITEYARQIEAKYGALVNARHRIPAQDHRNDDDTRLESPPPHMPSQVLAAIGDLQASGVPLIAAPETADAIVQGRMPRGRAPICFFVPSYPGVDRSEIAARFADRFSGRTLPQQAGIASTREFEGARMTVALKFMDRPANGGLSPETVDRLHDLTVPTSGSRGETTQIKCMSNANPAMPRYMLPGKADFFLDGLFD